ncbi:MAG: ArnT family glycosyltransferase [Pirellula sp.]
MKSEQKRPSNFRFKWTSIAVAAIVLFAVHAYSLLRVDGLSAPPLPHGDGPDYESIAYSLSVDSGFQYAWEDPQWQAPYRASDQSAQYTQLQLRDWPGPTTSRPPALPFLISLVYRLIPRGPIAFSCVRWLSVLALTIAGVLSIWLAFDLTERIILDSEKQTQRGLLLCSVSLGVTLGIAVMDRTIKTYLRDFFTEPWALLGVTATIVALLQWTNAPAKLPWILTAGILFGVNVLFRSIFVFWLPILVLGIAIVTYKTRANENRWWSSMPVFIVAFLLVVSPWWIRNCMLTGRLMPLGSQGAASLRGGYSHEALADWGNWHADAEIAMQAKLDSIPDSERWTASQREVALADLATKEIGDWIKLHWGDLPRLCAMRLASHWGPWRLDHLLWKFSAFAGLIWVWRSYPRQGIILASIFLADSLTIACLYETGGRFLIPLHAVLYALAGVGLAGCLALLMKNPVHLRDERQEQATG